MLLSLQLCVVLLIGRSKAQNYDEWIDPTDMLNYDAASGTMRKPEKLQEVSQDASGNKKLSADTVTEVDTSQCQKRLDSLTHKLGECEKKDKAKLYGSSSLHVFKRYLNKILNEAGRIGLPDDNSGDMHYDAEIILTKQTYNEISRFLNDEGWKSAALDEALSDILINFRHHDYETWKWKFEDTFGIDPYNVFMVLLCLVCIGAIVATELWTRIGWFTQLKRIMFISFIISFGWNWMYLYKISFAQHQAEVAKMGDFDKVCAEKIHWSDGIMEWFRSSLTFRDDPCQKYYETLLVNPILLVPPTKALAVTFTNFVTEPLKHIGQGIGEFIRALMKEIPVLLQLPVLIIIAGAFLIFCYGVGRSVTSIRQLNYQDRQHPPSLPPWNGQQEKQIQYLQQKVVDRRGGSLPGTTSGIERGPYDRGDASTNRYQSTESEAGNKNDLEVLQAGDMLDAQTEEHSKFAVKSNLSSKENSEEGAKQNDNGSHLSELCTKPSDQTTDSTGKNSIDQSPSKANPTELDQPCHRELTTDNQDERKPVINEDQNLKPEHKSHGLEESKEKRTESLGFTEQNQRNTASW